MKDFIFLNFEFILCVAIGIIVGIFIGIVAMKQDCKNCKSLLNLR